METLGGRANQGFHPLERTWFVHLLLFIVGLVIEGLLV